MDFVVLTRAVWHMQMPGSSTVDWMLAFSGCNAKGPAPCGCPDNDRVQDVRGTETSDNQGQNDKETSREEGKIFIYPAHEYQQTRHAVSLVVLLS